MKNKKKLGLAEDKEEEEDDDEGGGGGGGEKNREDQREKIFKKITGELMRKKWKRMVNTMDGPRRPDDGHYRV